MMKKKYETPTAEELAVQVESMLATSLLNGAGGENINITPGDDPFSGEFDAKGGGWDIWH